MQIEHCLLGTMGICSALVNSKPYTGKIKKGFWRRLIFLTGIIPRGRAKSPKAVIPTDQATESGLRELLAEAGLSAQKAAESDCDCWWKHFSFGVMKRDEALKFVEIHNKHYLIFFLIYYPITNKVIERMLFRDATRSVVIG